ncbi:hypothetical protein SAMN06265377_1182 [Flagellimonas pacifica]|uniref:Uncharacterized protein n=2 Tax=Flagellimonas pacifica TaxID=1247520 RepID=A0A285MS67_9FLAO|nr:hypothetical protein SAMN06265377_1182 [Allomuricauda parva]
MKSVFNFSMKKILPILLIAFLFFYVASCEKDDICVDGDTPLLVIGFFDADNPTEPKEVPSLRVKEVVLDQNINTITDRASNLDSIGIPLRIDTTSTQFSFITNSADDDTTGEETGNVDILTVSYSMQEKFVSRACGIVANYEEINVALPDNPENWIKDIDVVQQKVENSNNIHVKIFH